MVKGTDKSEMIVFSSDVPPTRDRVHAQTIARGMVLSERQFDQVFEMISNLHDLKEKVYMQEIEAITDEVMHTPKDGYKLLSVRIAFGSRLVPSAAVSIRTAGGEQIIAEATGNSSIDAIYLAIQRATKTHVFLKGFTYGNLTPGANSLGKATVRVEHHGRHVSAQACSMDILEAVARAFLNAISIINETRKVSS